MFHGLNIDTRLAAVLVLGCLSCNQSSSDVAAQISAESQAVAAQYLQVRDLPEFKAALKSFRTMSTKALITSAKEVPDSMFLRGKLRSGLRPIIAADYADLGKSRFAGDNTLGNFVERGAFTLDNLTANDVERYFSIMDSHIKNSSQSSSSLRDSRAMKDLTSTQIRRAMNAAIIIDMVSQNQAQNSGLNLYKWTFRWSDLTLPGVIAHAVEVGKCNKAESAYHDAVKASNKAKAETDKLISDASAEAEKTKLECEGNFPNFPCGDNHPENLDKIGRPDQPEKCRIFEYQCSCTLTDRNNTPPCNLNWHSTGSSLLLTDPAAAAAPAAAAPGVAADPNTLPEKCK